MVISVSALSTPVGAIKSWIRPDDTVPLPYGWLICDGSMVSDIESIFDGKTLPNLMSQFPRGHNLLDNSNFGVDTFYYTGGTVPTGGADSNNLSHPHNVNNHDHTYSMWSSSVSATAGGPASSSPVSPTHAHTVSGTTAATGGATVAALGATDNRPAFVEMVMIIKIK